MFRRVARSRPFWILYLVVLQGLIVAPAVAGGSPDFTLTVEWNYARLVGGQTAGFEAELASLNGFQGNVTLSIDCGSLIVGFNTSTTGSSVIPLHPGETTVANIAIAVPYDATEGVYCGILTATGNGLVRSASLQVEIPPFGVGTRLTHRLTETWETIRNTLSVSLERRIQDIIDLLLTFPPQSCLQVHDWGFVTRISNNFSVQVTVRNEPPTEGTCPQMTRTIGTRYSLGRLPPDNYTFSLLICLQENDAITCRNSQDLSFTTIDTPPVWPSNSEIRVPALTPTTVTLTWTYANDNFGVSKYKIYSGMELIGTTSGNIVCGIWGLCLHYNATGLIPGETYTFRVEACDLSDLCTLGPMSIITMPEQTTPEERPKEQQAMLVLTGAAASTIALSFLALYLRRKSKMPA